METLRLRPVIRTQRQAVRDTIIGPGIRIKAGTIFNLLKKVNIKVVQLVSFKIVETIFELSQKSYSADRKSAAR